MSKSTVITNVIVLFVGAAAGFAIAYKYKPRIISSVDVQTKTVVQNKIVTVIKKVKEPSGAEETDETITDNSVHTGSTDTVATKAPLWHVSIGAETTADLVPDYSMQIERRIAGPLFVGARAETRGAVGVTIGIEF